MKTLALYLPQFHTIPENDEWWGEGFTEWVNIKKAKPLFEGHNQPRVPLGGDYYDLRDVTVMERQARMAKKYGIYGFCFYHYWFHGKLLLETPAENFLKDKNIDFPFVFSWANDNWTNAWVSGENKILIKNEYDDEDDWVAHFNYLLPFFKDDRYIKEDNMPLFIIYMPGVMTQLEKFMDCFKKLAKDNGFDGIKFIYQESVYHLDKTKDKSCFDYGIEFEPGMSMREMNKKSRSVVLKTKISLFLQEKLHIYIQLKKKHVGLIDYDACWKFRLARKPDHDRMIPGFFVDWDNTPRRDVRGTAFKDANPEKFEKYFDLFVQKFKSEYSTDWAVLFAWNEWAEGGYVEPDEKFGYGYLEAIKKTLDKYDENPWS